MRLEQLQQRAPGVTAEPCRPRARASPRSSWFWSGHEAHDMCLSAAKFCHCSLREHTDTTNDDKSIFAAALTADKLVDLRS